MYLHLFKALNGLRSASQEWVIFLSEIVSELQLESDSLEPCLFTGRLKSGAVCMLLSYVDDILIASETEKDIEEVLSVIGKKVVLKKAYLTCKSTCVQLVFEQLLEKQLVKVWGSPPTLVRL